MAGIVDKLKNLFGPHSMARQFFLWSILDGVVKAALGPFFLAIEHRANVSNPNVIITPDVLADMVVRGVVAHEWAEGEARRSGVHPNSFKLMVTNTGQPPSLIDMLELMRRGEIDRDAVIRAVRQSRIKNEWIDTVLKLGVQFPSPTEILRAYLQGQVDGDRAKQLYTQLGGAPEFFQLLYDTEGSAPTPNEAAIMARRRIIPWEGSGPGVVSYQQAFLEGPWRNKWLEAFKRASDYLPPPRTITAMVREGSLTIPDATDLLARQGVPQALIGHYLTDASGAKVKHAKDLTESTVSTLYQERAISDDDAKAFLEKLRYAPSEVDFVLTTWRLARELKYRNAAIGTVHTQFINHKIDRQKASLLLDGFYVPAAQRDTLLALWTQEAEAKVAILTAAQIKTAWKKGILDDSGALSRLLNLGYSEDDAAIYLEI